MEKFKFILFTIITLFLMGLIGYWSVTTIQSGTEHVADQKVKQLTKENEDLQVQVQKLTDEVDALQPTPAAPNPVVTKPVVTTPTVYKYQSLVADLQNLIDKKVFLKAKSIGSNVGTVQKFLNIYNNTSAKIDNDYGPGMVKLVTAFEKDSGLTADGQAGPSVFSKMIDWLKKQG